MDFILNAKFEIYSNIKKYHGLMPRFNIVKKIKMLLLRHIKF